MTLPQADPQAVSAVHGGIQYTGELVRAPSWEPSLGSALDADAYFRVVFLESPTPPPVDDLLDARTAVHVPASPSPTLRSAESELRELREAQTRYGGDALASRPGDVEERVVEEWAASFREGQIVASPPVDIDTDAVFASGYWSAWAERIGEVLLARAYPEFPVDASKLRVPLRPEQSAPMILDGVVDPASNAGSIALDAFGPALGIVASRRGPDLSQCAGIDLVAAEAERYEGGSLGHRLAHELGLTYPLATLFALLYVLRESTEVLLAPSHRVRLRGGAPLDASRITAADLPRLAWPAAFWRDVEEIGTADARSADRVARYLGVLGVGMEAATDDERRASLRRWLGTMSDGLLSVTQHLTALAGAQRRELGDSELEPLARIRRLVEVDDAADVGPRAEAVFGGIDAFRTDMDLWEAWRGALDAAAALTGSLAFLELASIDDARPELLMERDTLASRLRDPGLLTSPQQWPALAEEASRFARVYADAYAKHHDAYHTQMEPLAHRMADVAVQGRALARLNSVADLGRPVSPELPALCEELLNGVRTCGAVLDLDAVARDAVCPVCGVRLGATPPADEVGSLASYVHEALGEQNARLARAVVHRLLSRDDHERLDRFIQVVEVSDLSGLANVLDDELTAFIGAMLREARA